MGALIGTVGRLGTQNPDPFALALDEQPLDDTPLEVNDPPVATVNMDTIVNGEEDLTANGNLITNIEAHPRTATLMATP